MGISGLLVSNCAVSCAMLLLLFCLFCFVCSLIFFGDTKIIHKMFFCYFFVQNRKSRRD